MEKGGIIKHDPKNAPKTGDWRFMKPEVDASKCIGCGTCMPHCPEAAIETIDRKQLTFDQKEKSNVKGQKLKVAKINYEYCKGCGVCAQICPLRAIIMKK
jgi:pyruvate ferredoxin oxidoreductase delta subunit